MNQNQRKFKKVIKKRKKHAKKVRLGKTDHQAGNQLYSMIGRGMFKIHREVEESGIRGKIKSALGIGKKKHTRQKVA